MKLAVGSDERTAVTEAVVAELRRRGHEVELVGPLVEDAAEEKTTAAGANGTAATPASAISANGAPTLWPDVARHVAEAVAAGEADEGILFCWTGTGVSIAANKVPGIRAALCDDAETARGARLWNNANVLCLSLRRTSNVIAREILDAWFSTRYRPNEDDDAALAAVDAIEADYS
jgi:ribose 5-phosphate isomerase B